MSTITPINEKAILVTVRVSTWEARRHDKRITDEVNIQHGANPNAGRYHKRLFGRKVASHQDVLNAAMAIRTIHHENTLPWEDTGWRLLPTKNYFKYVEAIGAARRRMYTALDKFMAEYPELIEQARKELNGMFRQDDYPTPSQVRDKFGSRVDYQPVPTGNDFRIGLPDEELDRVRRDIEDRVARSVSDAVQDVWQRIGEAIDALNERLDDGKYLRESMVTRIRQVAEAAGDLNVTDDPELESVRQQAMRDLGDLNVNELRDNEDVRLEAAQKAEDILARMRGMYGTAK